MTSRLQPLRDWVAEVADLAQPDRIHWCTGSDAEYQALTREMLAKGTQIGRAHV